MIHAIRYPGNSNTPTTSSVPLQHAFHHCECSTAVTAAAIAATRKHCHTVRMACVSGLAERLNTRLRAAEDESVDVVRALVGVDHLEVDDVADDAELIRNSVAAEHVARGARDVERLAAGIPFHDRGDLDRGRAFVLHTAKAQAALEAERDLGLHVGELLLDELVGGERAPELLAIEHVLPCPV